MKDTAKRFQEEIVRRLESICEGQEDTILKAAKIVAQTIENGGIVQSFGSGHSYGNALEISGRAGGFIQTKIINEPSRGNYEMVEGVGTQFMKHLDLRKEDTLVLISNSGRNPMGIEIAMGAKAIGVKIIVVTAYAIASTSTSRHSSGNMLHEFADVILDNRSTLGDCCIEVPGMDVKVGGSSLYTGCLLLDCVMLDALDMLLEKGITPPVFMSANIDGGPAFNQRYLDMFKDRLTQF